LFDSLLELYLSSIFLEGPLLEEDIRILSSLESLNFALNELPGISPGNQLATLDISDSRFTGLIIPDLVYLTNLKSLDLSGNDLSGLSLPMTCEVLSSMTKLQSLDLSGIDIGFFPTHITNLTNLENLNLSFISITVSIPPELDLLLSNLKRLDLSDNSISGEILSSLTMIPKLEDLDLGRNAFMGFLP